MAATKIILTIAEQIDRAREGRTQTYIIKQMRDAGIDDIDDSKFSRKKLGHDQFTEKELQVLSEILGTELSTNGTPKG